VLKIFWLIAFMLAFAPDAHTAEPPSILSRDSSPRARACRSATW